MRDLRNDYLRVMKMVERGEIVRITRRGEIFARLTPEKKTPQKMDWNQSAAVKLDRSDLSPITDQQMNEIFALSRGED